MEIRDSKGLTEEEYIAAYQKKNYPKPALTADIIVFRRETDEVLLVKRGGHPFIGRYALPGGFANMNEPAEATAARELCEETGLDGLTLTPVGFYSKPFRDPRGWTVSMAYMAVIEGSGYEAEAGDDAAEAKWFRVNGSGTSLTLTCGGETIVTGTDKNLAFDHDDILTDAYRLYKAK